MSRERAEAGECRGLRTAGHAGRAASADRGRQRAEREGQRHQRIHGDDQERCRDERSPARLATMNQPVASTAGGMMRVRRARD